MAECSPKKALAGRDTATTNPAKPEKKKIKQRKPFTEDARWRKGIIVLNQSQINDCRRKGLDDVIHNEDIQVLEFPVTGSQKTIQEIIRRRLDQPRTLLVQSPFENDKYEEVTQAREQFMLAKHLYFSRFCQLLGARKVYIKEIRQTIDSKPKTWTAKGDAEGGRGEISAESNKLDAFKLKLTLKDIFEGGQSDLKAAKELLRQKNLDLDQTMAELFEIRQSNSNQLKSRDLYLDLSKEANRNLRVIGEVTSFAKLGIGHESIFKEKLEYSLTIEVRF